MTTASLIVSVLALLVSGSVAWATLFRRGRVLATKPTQIYFGPDGVDRGWKVVVQTLVYCTARTGRIIEAMWVRVRRGDVAQTFGVWVLRRGEKELTRGCGLHVGAEGVASAHHFLLENDSPEWKFLAGRYEVEMFARMVGESRPHRLVHLTLDVTEEQAAEISRASGLFYDWSPDVDGYAPNVHRPMGVARAVSVSRSSGRGEEE